MQNTIVIDLHYNFIDSNAHSINFYTKNACSLAQVEIISYIIDTLYPNERFEIVSLPSQNGSFKDISVVKFLNDNLSIVTIACTVVSTIFPLILYSSQARVNKTTGDINTLSIIEKCKSTGLLDDEEIKKIEEICNSYISKKQKNIFYESVILDNDVISIQPTVIDNNKYVFEEEIPKIYFKDYIEELPKEKEYLKTNLSGHIQLSQPFIDKQKQYGRGVAWKGVYYGQDVLDDSGELIIRDGENVFFYMQDDDYKKQILKQEISFKNGDNINVVFDISRYYSYVNGRYSNPALYVKRVESHNDNLVQHKKDLELKIKKQRLYEKNKNQGSLFDDTQK